MRLDLNNKTSDCYGTLTISDELNPNKYFDNRIQRSDFEN